MNPTNFSNPNFANLNALRNMGGGFGSNPPQRILPGGMNPFGGGQSPIANPIGPYPVSPIARPVGPAPFQPIGAQPVQPYPVQPGFGANPPQRVLPEPGLPGQEMQNQAGPPGGFDMNNLQQLLALRQMMMQRQAY